MSDNTDIQCKTEKHSFGFGAEKVSTTLCLVNMGAGKVGLRYESKFSGIKDGDVSGGPIEIDGNLEKTIHNDPKVAITVSGYQNTGSYASMHVKIVVDGPFPIGKVTIYDQTLGGNFQAQATGWAVALDSVANSLREARAAQ